MSDSERIKPYMADNFMAERVSLPTFGPVDIELPTGLCHVEEVPGLALIDTGSVDGCTPKSLALITYMPAPADSPETGFGLCAQIDAASARNLAAQLLALANQIDGGAVN